MNNKIAKVQVDTNLKLSIQKVIDELGGFESFIKKGDRVLVKPNYNTADPPPASTDPEFLAVFVDLLHENGASEVMIGESSTFFDLTTYDLKRAGVFALKENRPWLDVVSFDEQKWIARPVTGGKYLKSVKVPKILEDYDRLFFVCCLKTHCHARFTGSLKLSVGLMKQQQRLALHARNIQPKIAELASLFKPDLVLMDARKCFINKGPMKGEVREPGMILASQDRVALDVAGIKIIQSYEGNSLADLVNPADLPQIKRAIEMGLGNPEETNNN